MEIEIWEDQPWEFRVWNEKKKEIRYGTMRSKERCKDGDWTLKKKDDRERLEFENEKKNM